MKKFVLLILLVIAIGASSITYFFGSRATSTEIASVPVPTTQPTVSPELLGTPMPYIGKPKSLVIESIGVDAQVEHVGLAPDNRMDVPKEDMNVAWYNLGATPGQLGNAVIAGHFDAKDGSPAVFAPLQNIAVGAEIKVITETNEELMFIVTEIETYKDATFPIETVFGPNTKPMLNLITCDGVFDSTARNYSDRLVVFAEMQG